MKVVKSDVIRIIRVTENPEKEMERLTTYPHEVQGDAYYVQLYEENLGERIDMQTGNYDVPSPADSYRQRLIQEYERELRRGKRIYQFILEDYSYYDTFEDESKPSKPDYEEYEEAPEGWLTVDEVVKDKDVDKSTVTRAIYSGDIYCIIVPSERRRYVKPDASYRDWAPSRKKSYLRDRRLMMAKEVLASSEVFDVDGFLSGIIKLEEDRFGGNHLPEDGTDGLALFLKDTLGEFPPTVWDWMSRIDDFLEEHGLNDDPKKLKRAFGEDRVAKARERLNS